MGKPKYNLPLTDHEMLIVIRAVYNYSIDIEYEPQYLQKAYPNLVHKLEDIETKDKLQ